MKITQALWGTLILLINLPPMAHPESKLNSAATATLSAPSATPPNSPVTPIGSVSRNMAPTDGAAGLFTPNGLGNAAALDAQLNGGLTASPIVDGTGANVHLTVPIATPPADVRSESDAAKHEVQNTAVRVSPNVMVTPTYRNSMAPYPVPRQFTQFRNAPVSARILTRAKPRSNASSTNLSERVKISRTANTLDSIGQLTGSITYADGKKVLLGTEGNAFIDPDKGTLTLPNGSKLSMKSAAKSVRQVALKNQVRL